VPELPEVETVRRTIKPEIVGSRITAVEVLKPVTLRTHSPVQASRLLKGRTITDVDRRGKTLLIRLSKGWTLMFHYSLWGVVLVRRAPSSDGRAWAVIHLSNGRVIEFRELQLSNLHLFPDSRLDRVPYLAGLGVDPLDKSITPARFRKILNGRGAIRPLLSDQSRLAGIGNLWALEILFAAKLRPTRKAETFTDEMWRRLYRATRSVLQRAIRAGGEPEFIDAKGRTGRYRLAVYGRGGQPCRVCGTKIATGRVGGRPAFWCPKCQR
jgi:formamidopyrimidine-DNA glycosylase